MAYRRLTDNAMYQRLLIVVVVAMAIWFCALPKGLRICAHLLSTFIPRLRMSGI